MASGPLATECRGHCVREHWGVPVLHEQFGACGEVASRAEKSAMVSVSP